MKRLSFLKSLAALIVAPSIVGEIDFAPASKLVLQRVVKIRKAAYFKIAAEMLDDVPYLTYLFEDKSSPLYKAAVKQGVDIYNSDIVFGYDNDDFISNRATVVIKERYEPVIYHV